MPIGCYTSGRPDSPGFGTTSYLNYRDIRDQTQRMSAVGGYSEDVSVVEGKDGSVSVVAPRMTPNLFSMLGAQPIVGRTFTQAEGESGGPQVALLSEGLWRQSFSADPGIVGRTVRIGGIERTVVGVLPASFHFPDSIGPDIEKGVWLPLQPTAEMLNGSRLSLLQCAGADAVRRYVAQVQQEIDAIVAAHPASRSEGIGGIITSSGLISGTTDRAGAAGVPGATRCAVARSAHCLRECCESAHRALPGTEAGVRGSGRTGREPRPIDRSAARRRRSCSACSAVCWG